MDSVNACMTACTVYIQHGQCKFMYDSKDSVNVCMTAWTVYVQYGQCNSMYDSMGSLNMYIYDSMDSV